MDVYTQYARWRGNKRFGLGNRRLAGMLGDFVYETSSAEDESRRILEYLYEHGRQVLSGKDLKVLERFTSEHNRDKRRSDGEQELHVSWHQIDRLSKQIVNLRAHAADRDDSDFAENLAALDRMFTTTEALREFRNRVDHRAPSDQSGPLHFYRDDSPVSARAIWGWTEVAASYWTNLTDIGSAICTATGIHTGTLSAISRPRPFQWPPVELSIHGLRVLQASGILIPQHQLREARDEWADAIKRLK
jgi:hypothetical protein